MSQPSQVISEYRDDIEAFPNGYDHFTGSYLPLWVIRTSAFDSRTNAVDLYETPAQYGTRARQMVSGAPRWIDRPADAIRVGAISGGGEIIGAGSKVVLASATSSGLDPSSAASLVVKETRGRYVASTEEANRGFVFEISNEALGYFFFPASTPLSALVATSEMVLASATSAGIDPRARWIGFTEKRLTDLVEERTDEGDRVVKEGVIAKAWSYVFRLFGANVPTPSVLPTDDGGVEFAWHKGGWDLLLDIETDRTFAWARHRADGGSWHGTIEECWANIISLLSVLSRF